MPLQFSFWLSFWLSFCKHRSSRKYTKTSGNKRTLRSRQGNGLRAQFTEPVWPLTSEAGGHPGTASHAWRTPSGRSKTSTRYKSSKNKPKTTHHRTPQRTWFSQDSYEPKQMVELVDNGRCPTTGKHARHEANPNESPTIWRSVGTRYLWYKSFITHYQTSLPARPCHPYIKIWGQSRGKNDIMLVYLNDNRIPLDIIFGTHSCYSSRKLPADKPWEEHALASHLMCNKGAAVITFKTCSASRWLHKARAMEKLLG